jgi:hypothetical protein
MDLEDTTKAMAGVVVANEQTLEDLVEQVQTPGHAGLPNVVTFVDGTPFEDYEGERWPEGALVKTPAGVGVVNGPVLFDGLIAWVPVLVMPLEHHPVMSYWKRTDISRCQV